MDPGLSDGWLAPQPSRVGNRLGLGENPSKHTVRLFGLLVELTDCDIEVIFKLEGERECECKTKVKNVEETATSTSILKIHEPYGFSSIGRGW